MLRPSTYYFRPSIPGPFSSSAGCECWCWDSPRHRRANTQCVEPQRLADDRRGAWNRFLGIGSGSCRLSWGCSAYDCIRSARTLPRPDPGCPDAHVDDARWSPEFLGRRGSEPFRHANPTTNGCPVVRSCRHWPEMIGAGLSINSQPLLTCRPRREEGVHSRARGSAQVLMLGAPVGLSIAAPGIHSLSSARRYMMRMLLRCAGRG